MTDMKIRAHCPMCGYEVDDASGVGEAKDDRPEPGNVAICIRCAGVGVYFVQSDNTLGLRPPTAEQTLEFADDEEINKVRAVIIGRELWMKP